MIRAHQFYAAFAEKIDNHPVQNCGAHLRFDIIANDGQILIGKPFGPNRIAGDEDGDVIDKTEPGFERATGVETGRLFGADRKIIDHDFRRGITQFGDDLFAGGFFFQRQECAQGVLVAHVRRETVEHAAHFYDCAGEFDFLAEDFCAIRRRKYGLAHVEAHFAPVNIKCGNDLNIVRLIRAYPAMH